MNAFKLGNFNFYRDADLTQVLTDDNLFDQIDSEGWTNIWLGGSDIWLPDYGTFNIHIINNDTFFWDIVDENGSRTKNGFSAMQIPYNPNFEAHIGDIIPSDTDKIFDYTVDAPATKTEVLNCANLWFYTNYFDDEYYRYSLLILHIDDDPWPNEPQVKVRPMNDNLEIYEGEYIVGYRPKIEYMSQLAVLKTLKSGKENSIMFRLKVDLSYLAENPNTKRSIRIYNNSPLEYMLYPKSEADIIWKHHTKKFVNEYQRYLLDNAVSQYLPDDQSIDWGERIYEEFMDASNTALRMDTSNLRTVSENATKVINNKEVVLNSYSKLIIPMYLEWRKENLSNDVVTKMRDILYRVILTRKFFKGFEVIDQYMGGDVGFFDPADEPTYNKYISTEEFVPLVKSGGVYSYENRFYPSSMLWYLAPDKERYERATLAGQYSITMDNDEVVEVQCDNKGWMYIITGYMVSGEYLGQFGIPQDVRRDEDGGIGWTGAIEIPIKFSEMKCKISGVHNGGHNIMEIISSRQILKFSDGAEEQTLNIDGLSYLFQEDLVQYPIETSIGGDSLTIKMSGNRFITMLAVR